MNTSIKTLLAIVIIILGVLVYQSNSRSTTGEDPLVPTDTSDEVVVEGESIIGCYVATLGQDVYSLGINSQNGQEVHGTLVFDNYQKDNSSGTFVGAYRDGILLGEYSFRSEGMDSVMQVIFKQTDRGFIRGFGDVDEETGTRFTDMASIDFDSPYEFVLTDITCPTAPDQD